MNEQVDQAINALAQGWTVEIDRSRPGPVNERLDHVDLESGLPEAASCYELRVYRVAKTARDSATSPHSISAIDANAARRLLARGAVYVGLTRESLRPTPTDPSLPPVRG